MSKKENEPSVGQQKDIENVNKVRRVEDIQMMVTGILGLLGCLFAAGVAIFMLCRWLWMEIFH